MKPTHAPTLIEALARHLCRADGKLPDHPVAYEEGDGIWMLRDQPRWTAGLARDAAVAVLVRGGCGRRVGRRRAADHGR